ncbi:TetR/AcrR family transcriptional regulator [Nonomuraea zeae]|uniref:TetR/AcrR family transcriptional regulator n=2 Tax=Nonomuraea zeae TaxID=1642303 RepID=A0A5S4H349_9ACTN|nr:TetR/AcrR family transcriptional regulator [Nonomuraea zeae]
MSPEQRREMIVRAALPLVVEYGTSLTTAQVARAAGIGEGTIFRAFGDKDALLAACMAEALRPDDTLAHVASISLDQPLAERLIEAAEALRGYLARMGAVAGALAASGGFRRRGEAALRGAPARPDATQESAAGGPPVEGQGAQESRGAEEGQVPQEGGAPQEGREPQGGVDAQRLSGREASMAATRDVLVGLFEPEQDNLRLAPERLAEAFQFLVMAAGRGPSPLSSAELVDLFLHGAIKDGEEG